MAARLGAVPDTAGFLEYWDCNVVVVVEVGLLVVSLALLRCL